MTAIPDFLGMATTLVMLALAVAGVMKLFQIASDVQEIKEAAKDLRKGSQGFGSLPASMPYAAAPVPSASIPTVSAPALAALRAALPDRPLQPPASPFSQPPTAEELVRAVHAQKFGDDEFPL